MVETFSPSISGFAPSFVMELDTFARTSRGSEITARFVKLAEWAHPRLARNREMSSRLPVRHEPRLVLRRGEHGNRILVFYNGGKLRKGFGIGYAAFPKAS